MLTSDQIRELLDDAAESNASGTAHGDQAAISNLIEVLNGVLPDLVALDTQSQRPESRQSDGFSAVAEAMVEELRAVRDRHRALIRSAGTPERNRAILTLRARGFSYHTIGDALQISANHVMKIVRDSRERPDA